ncbi:MAG TPA: sce7725 family protein [Allosphingosinicella sp.]
MYHPYFRGKQYELITIRENAEVLAAADFTPIIEPVKESLGGLQRALQAVCDADGNVVVIVNPHHGDHAGDGEGITALLADQFVEFPKVSAGILLKGNMTAEEAIGCCDAHDDHDLTLIHAGFTQARALVEGLGDRLADTKHVFFPQCGALYRRHFQDSQRVLLDSGFERRRNRDYPLVERFSDIHITYADAGMDGFGDFLIVGDEFSETGGPAYAIAIHVTFIDPDQDDEMYVYHFVSDRQDTPTDPAGKFAEALNTMIQTLDAPNSKVFESRAVQEFRQFHANQHYPGLGYVKKLSMQHHIETLANYFE